MTAPLTPREADNLLRPREAAAKLGVSPKTLARMSVKRIIFTDRTFRYRASDLEDFIKGHEE